MKKKNLIAVIAVVVMALAVLVGLFLGKKKAESRYETTAVEETQEEPVDETEAYVTAQKKSDVYQAYADYLESEVLITGFAPGVYQTENSEIVYSLEYINEDDIPELIYGQTCATHPECVHILTYIDGVGVVHQETGSFGEVWFWKGRNILRAEDHGGGCDSYMYRRLNAKGKLENLCYCYLFDKEFAPEGMEDEYVIFDEQVTKDEYDDYVAKMDISDEPVFWACGGNKNNYSYITPEEIQNLRNRVD